MGTHREIKIKTETPPTGAFEVRPFNVDTASHISELLQRNHDNYHIYIHNLGLHNHILHHLLALYALGATPGQLDQAFNLATGSQRPTRPPDARRVLDLADPVKFRTFLGKGKYYDDFFAFFQKEISTKGWHATVNEYLFRGDERAEDMMRRFFSGFLHSPIHLGYAIEFCQPLVAAEALALTAVHDSGFGEILAMVEHASNESPDSKGMIELQQEIYANSNIRNSMDYDHGVFQIRDNLLVNARDDFLRIISHWKVNSETLKEKTAELLNSTSTTGDHPQYLYRANMCSYIVYWTALAQRPDKQIRFDFFLMHSITAGSLWPALNSASWISPVNKCRLLEWKGRSDLMLYCQSGAPQLHAEELILYRPKIPSGWPGVFHRACEYGDDGHLVKLIRAIATAAEDIKSFPQDSRLAIRSARELLTIAHMVIDSSEEFNQNTADHEAEMICAKYEYPRLMSHEIQRVTARWPRHVGFEQSWFHIPARKPRPLAQL